MSIDIGQCRTILGEFASQISHDKSLPVRLRPICRQLGVTSIRRTKLKSGAALLVDAGTKPKILVKAPDELQETQKGLSLGGNALSSHTSLAIWYWRSIRYPFLLGALNIGR
jgi:hypothetical protein